MASLLEKRVKSKILYLLLLFIYKKGDEKEEKNHEP
jgi:hypothetical protein